MPQFADPEEQAQWDKWAAANIPPKPKKKPARPPTKKKKLPKLPPTTGIGITRIWSLRAICRELDAQARAHGIPVDMLGGIDGFDKQLRKLVDKYRLRQRALYQQRKPLMILPEGHWVPPVKEARDAGQFPK